MTDLKDSILDYERQLQAAAETMARESHIKLTLNLWKYDLTSERRESLADTSYRFEWILPLVGTTKLDRPVVVLAEHKDSLEVHKNSTFNGDIVVSDAYANASGTGPMAEGCGIPVKDSPGKLRIHDLSGGFWDVHFTFTKNVLTHVSLVHDSAEHAVLTDYRLKLNTFFNVCYYRSTYSKKLGAKTK